MAPRTQYAALAAAVTLLALVGLAGSSRLSGPVIWRLNESHGLHLDDLGVLALWAGCLVWCWRQWRRTPPR